MLLRSHGGGNCSGDGGVHEGGPDLHPTEFNSISLNALEGIEQFYFLMWFKKTRLETPFKCDNVKA